MKNFEEIIAPWVQILQDPKMESVKVFKMKQIFRRKHIDLSSPNNYTGNERISDLVPLGCSKKHITGVRNKVHTPLGIFNSAKEAAVAHNIKPSTVALHCREWTPRNFFYYKEPK